MTTLFIHDYETSGKDNSEALVRAHLAGPGAPTIVATTGRNELLDGIAECDPGGAIALIDLQRDNYPKGNYVGTRIIQAIRRHEVLALRCRPLALTRWDSPEVIDAVYKLGAYGLVRHNELERTVRTPANLRLATHLADVFAMPCDKDPTAPVNFTIIPQHAQVPVGAPMPLSLEALAERRRDDMPVVRCYFPGLPPGAAPFGDREWMILQLLRDGFDRGTVAKQITLSLGGEESTVNKRIDTLRQAAAAAYRNPRVDLGRLADDLFKALPHNRPAPQQQPDLAALPDPGEAGALCADQQLVRRAWISNDCVAAIRAVHSHWKDPHCGSHGRAIKATIAAHVEALNAAISAASTRLGSDLSATYAHGALQLLDAQGDPLRRS